VSSPDLCKKFQTTKAISFVNHLKNENCPHCQGTIRNIRVVSRTRSAAKNAMWLLSGAILSQFVLYLVSTFWPIWPASHVDVMTSGGRSTSGNTVGCFSYMSIITTDRGFDDAYVKMRFPFKVSDVKAGTMPNDALSTEKSISVGLTEVERSASGDCKVVQTIGTDESEVAAKVIGGSVVIQMAKFQPNTRAMMVVVGRDEQPLDKTEPSVVHEGTLVHRS